MILIICFILLISCFIEIDKDVDHQSHSTDYNYRLLLPWHFSNDSFLTIYRDELDEELYCLSIQVYLGYITYEEDTDDAYPTGYFNIEWEHNFVFNNEFYSKYLRVEY